MKRSTDGFTDDDDRHFAYEGFRPCHPRRSAHTRWISAWALSDDVPEKLPLCFYDGRIFVDKGQEEILTHAAVKTAIVGTMYQLLLELDFGDFFINGVLLSNLEAQVSNNPDMLAISWESLESGKVRYIRGRKNRESVIVGSPDWALEIVSQSSVTKDKQDLRRAYH